ncbi:cell growth regulator with EF hand domain protein 1 isoform X1 [Salarias fasciatus]|uniref:EF-hand domain-containing protein n=1 Tax=Salarias fasciatus TaxID=181472 RepID=A0A672GTM0_SALFA|nr:cell growth regulator with EF hand domain protein 1 isoform X1 [Salarias fasciatus]
MRTGVFMEPHLDRMGSCILSLLLLIHLCLAAPGLTGSEREETLDAHPPFVALRNPFGSAEEDRGLLQSYIQENVKSSPEEPELSTREQEVFFLFRLYDYDRSDFLDGLEMMKLLSDYNSHHTPGAQASEQVVSMVDFLLQTQDLNHDGLLTPSELLSPPLTHTQDSSNAAPPREVKVEVETSNTNTEENAEATEQEGGEEGHEDMKFLEEEQPQHEVETEEQEVQHEEQQIPEAAAQEEQVHRVPVHQGQPEI